MFEPDALMPEQFFGGSGREDGASNERTLMLAILRDAVECHQKYARSRDFRNWTMFEEADEWIFSTDREWPFSFENICAALGIEAGYIRAGLSAGRQGGARKRRRSPRIVSVGDRASELTMGVFDDERVEAQLSEAS